MTTFILERCGLRDFPGFCPGRRPGREKPKKTYIHLMIFKLKPKKTLRFLNINSRKLGTLIIFATKIDNVLIVLHIASQNS